MFFSCSNDDEAGTKNNNEELKKELQQLLDAATTTNQFPGLSLSVITGNDSFTLSSGYAALPSAKINENNLCYMQSISKTFTAAAILKLTGEGKINLNATINNYLPESITNAIANGSTTKVRHLLNMTSGLPDYIEHPDFFNDIVTNPLPFDSQAILGYVYNRPAHFTPGTNYHYANINYHLLALIIEEVTGQNHNNYIKDNVIAPSGLKRTFYIPQSGLTAPLAGTTSCYIADNGSFTDISELQFGTVMSFIGDDGIVATTTDIAAFYNALLNKKTILPTALLNEMMIFTNFNGQPEYGLGLYRFKTSSGKTAIGHDGSGAGAATEAFYFPDSKTTIVLATNVGTLTDEEKAEAFRNLRNAIFSAIIK